MGELRFLRIEDRGAEGPCAIFECRFPLNSTLALNEVSLRQRIDNSMKHGLDASVEKVALLNLLNHKVMALLSDEICPQGGVHRWRTKKGGLLDNGLFGLPGALMFGSEDVEECTKCRESR